MKLYEVAAVSSTGKVRWYAATAGYNPHDGNTYAQYFYVDLPARVSSTRAASKLFDIPERELSNDQGLASIEPDEKIPNVMVYINDDVWYSFGTVAQRVVASVRDAIQDESSAMKDGQSIMKALDTWFQINNPVEKASESDMGHNIMDGVRGKGDSQETVAKATLKGNSIKTAPEAPMPAPDPGFPTEWMLVSVDGKEITGLAGHDSWEEPGSIMAKANNIWGKAFGVDLSRLPVETSDMQIVSGAFDTPNYGRCFVKITRTAKPKPKAPRKPR